MSSSYLSTQKSKSQSSGWLALNEHGDRREDWDFDFWVLKYEDDKYYWEKAARYQFEPGTAKELFLSNEASK